MSLQIYLLKAHTFGSIQLEAVCVCVKMIAAGWNIVYIKMPYISYCS